MLQSRCEERYGTGVHLFRITARVWPDGRADDKEIAWVDRALKKSVWMEEWTDSGLNVVAEDERGRCSGATVAPELNPASAPLNPVLIAAPVEAERTGWNSLFTWVLP